MARDDRAAARPTRRSPRRTPRAHERYLEARAPSSASVPEIEGVSAGGMPDRVKCLHVLAGQALAQGPGVNPLGDEVLERLGAWWAPVPAWTPAVPPARASRSVTSRGRHRLRHQHVKLLVADLDPRPATSASWSARPAWCGSARASTPPAGCSDEALERVFAAVEEYAGLVARARRARGCASAPPRRRGTPRNADVFVAGVRAAARGRPRRCCRGAEEAALSFAGATRGPRRRRPRPVLVVDIGGGSTELVLGDAATAGRTAGALPGHRLGAADRAVPDSGPARRPRGGAPCAAIDEALDTLPGARRRPRRRPAPWSRSPAPG